MVKKEDSRIKSLLWTNDDIIFYNTHEHLKYGLINGESGMVKTINKIVFMSFTYDNKIISFDINEQFEEIELDLTEISFYNAVAHNDTEKIQQIIKSK